MFRHSTAARRTPRTPRRASHPHRTAAAEAAVLIRPAAAADDVAIAQLAALEELPELPGDERLVGEVEGRVVAALDLDSGRAVADPFVATTKVVELLGLRAEQVRR